MRLQTKEGLKADLQSGFLLGAKHKGELARLGHELVGAVQNIEVLLHVAIDEVSTLQEHFQWPC